jgi:hypothetical protein
MNGSRFGASNSQLFDTLWQHFGRDGEDTCLDLAELMPTPLFENSPESIKHTFRSETSTYLEDKCSPNQTCQAPLVTHQANTSAFPFPNDAMQESISTMSNAAHFFASHPGSPLKVSTNVSRNSVQSTTARCDTINASRANSGILLSKDCLVRGMMDHLCGARTALNKGGLLKLPPLVGLTSRHC